VSGNLNYGNLAENPLLNGRGIYMYVQLAPDSQLRRVLEWTPQVAGHYIFCYAATEPGSPLRSSTQRCLDLDVKVSFFLFSLSFSCFCRPPSAVSTSA
jgi:hypothetical protein